MFRLLGKLVGILLIAFGLLCLLQLAAIRGSWMDNYVAVLTFAALAIVSVLGGKYVMDRSAFSSPMKLDFEPENELEERLLNAAEDVSNEPAFFEALRNSRLFALRAQDEDNSPMTTSVQFDPSIDPRADEEQLNHGPFLWCFTSEKRVEQFRNLTPFSGFVEQAGVCDFDARRLFQFAFEQDVCLVLNPFLACGRTFSQHDLQAGLG